MKRLAISTQICFFRPCLKTKVDVGITFMELFYDCQIGLVVGFCDCHEATMADRIDGAVRIEAMGKGFVRWARHACLHGKGNSAYQARAGVGKESLTRRASTKRPTANVRVDPNVHPTEASPHQMADMFRDLIRHVEEAAELSGLDS